MDVAAVLLVVALVLSGLVAGLLFGWQVAVIPGLRPLSDRTYVEVMQSINRAILNPVFLIAFLGTALALPVAAIASFIDEATTRGWWLVAASAAYVIGVIGVTAVGNIPLNNRLDAVDLESPGDLDGPADLATERSMYESSWNRWHLVRTAAAIAAVAAAAIASQ